MTTFKSGELRVTIKGGKVVESNWELMPVGTRITATRFADFGWNKVKKVVQYDVFGRKMN